MDAKIVPETVDANVHPPTLEETAPQFLADTYYWVVLFLEQNGWYLFGGGMILLYIWSKVNVIIKKWMDDRAEQQFRAKLHKDPDLFRVRQEAQEIARLRLQQQHDMEASIAEEKRKEREKKRQEEWLARHGGNSDRGGHRLCDSSTSAQNDETIKAKKAVLRPEYNPLASGGGSGGFRPTRRTCPGGGCG